MTATFRRTLLVTAGLGAGSWFLTMANARQPAFPAPPMAVAVAVAAAASPAPVKASSPVDLFRRLLAMNSGERGQYLANRPEENRRGILAKINEYEALKPEERELRLQVTEMHWYLGNFMQLPAANRAAQLAAVPDSVRKLVADRLELWDRLPPEEQREFLGHDVTASWFTGPPLPPGMVPAVYSAAEREQIKTGLEIWKIQPPPLREKMLGQVQKFFVELSDEEQRKTLAALSPAERRQMENALQTFDSLPPQQREKCIRSFGKLASLSNEERDEFLRNAARWHDLSPAERQAWCSLVRRFPEPPPLPPGFHPPLPPGLTLRAPAGGPPLPPSASRSATPLATNARP